MKKCIITVCHNKRTSSNRVFNKISKIAKSSYGWFLVFKKLYLIIDLFRNWLR
ncbi:transposase [Orientia tsutsugamushi]|nr:transposase DDE domain protein [Orientia tsutsugamushi str. TA763]SPP26365.1 transposase [Orientia tsutsugamushi]